MAWTTPTTAVAGNAILASLWNSDVKGNTEFLYTPPMCKVRRKTNLTGYTTATAVTWDQEDIDTDGMYTSGTNVTINTAGVYLIHQKMYLTCTATLTGLGAAIGRNGNLIEYVRYPPQDTTSGYGECTKIISLSVGDTITARPEIFGGSNYVLNGVATDTHVSTSLSVMWMGKA